MSAGGTHTYKKRESLHTIPDLSVNDLMAMDCKLCFKRFSNGKALGAHMRSHYAILPLPPKTAAPQIADSTGSESGSTRPGFKRSDGMNLDDDREEEEEEEVTKNENSAAESGLGMEEDVALCLIMLSRDAWRSDPSGKVYRCERCDKVFKSSQGLGSHKASHFKKIRSSEKRPPSEIVGEDQVHECALCFRIFKSAQALGGHKRSHFQALKFGTGLVDLNLPAAVEVVNEEIVA